MKTYLAFATVASLATASCAPGVGHLSVAQSAYAMEASYQGALTLAVAYRNLPRCGTPGAVVCHDPVVVAKLVTADGIAHTAILGVEGVVRAGGSPLDVQHAIAIAQTALSALQALAASLPSALPKGN